MFETGKLKEDLFNDRGIVTVQIFSSFYINGIINK